MSTTPADYLVVAKTLSDFAAGEAKSEAYLRGACSRAYYSAYGELRVAIEHIRPMVFRSRGRHTHLVQALQHDSTDHQLRKVGVRLNHLKDQRELADYDWANPVSDSYAKLSLSRAASVLQSIQVLTGPQIHKIAMWMAANP